MSNIQTGAERMPHDLSHLGFLAGQIGRLITISTTPVIAGDSFEMDAVGALRLSPLRRGLAVDSTVAIFTFKAPWMPDRTEANPNELNQDDARYGFRCCHLKNIWTAPLPPETELSRQMTTSTTSIDIMGLQAAYANLHTDQERDYFMQRYHD